MKRVPWVPLDASFQADSKLVEVSALAELLFVRSLGHVKRTENAISEAALRQLCDKFDMTAIGRRALAEELTTAGVWGNGGPGWFVTMYDEWNGDADMAQAKAVEDGYKGAHQRYHVGQGVVEPTCKWCLSPGQVGAHSPPTSDPIGTLASHPMGSPLADEMRRDEMRQDNSSSSTVYPRPVTKLSDDDDPDEQATLAASDALDAMGYAGAASTPNRGEVRTVRRALDRGATLDAMLDLAERCADGHKPRRAWLKGLTELGSTNGPAPSPIAVPAGPKPPETMSAAVESDQDALNAEVAERWEVEL